MSACQQRYALAAVGQDLIAQDGGPGDRRARALLRSLAGTTRPPTAFNDLSEVPDWLRLPRAALRSLARRVALMAMAPALAGTIDGELLGAYAKGAGEDAVDWAISRADKIPHGGLPLIEAPMLTGCGLDLMRQTLPKTLQHLLETGDEDIEVSAALAQACVAEAVAGARAS